MLHRYHRRFSGIGTIVTLDDGRAFTAAHCLAAADGRRGVIVEGGTRRWQVVRRWSPRRTDLALLQAVGSPGRTVAPDGGAARLAARSLVRTGVQVEIVGHTGRRFQSRTATVIAVASVSATAVVAHPRGVCANDSGGPVYVDGVLVGIMTHRTGSPLSSRCSQQLVFTRLDSPEMRRRIRRAWGPSGRP